MKKLISAFFLLLAVQCSLHAQNAFSVHFAHGSEHFPENFAIVRQNGKVGAQELLNGQYTRYIQLEKIMTATERNAFEATGARIIGYVDFGAYLVLLPQNFDFQAIERFAPRSVVPVQTAWKLARSLREQPYGEWAVRGHYLDVNLQLYPSLNIPEGAALCRKHGFEVLKEGQMNGFVQLRIHKDRVGELAAMPFVQYLELVPPPGQKEDTRGRSLHRANLVASDGPMGKKYDGSGVGVLVRDDGKLGPHIDIQGRLYNYANTPEIEGTHGDGVVGIVGGAGNLDPKMKGMAAGADMFSVDYINDFQDLTMPLHLNEGVTLTNTSYSDGCNAGYTLAAQTVDRQIFENPTLMHVFSAGNSNETNCGYGAGIQWGNITGGHKMAKNAIATANLFADATLVVSSSRGPAYDGRLKPDIAANGEAQFSLNPNNAYQEFGGTSGAAPGIAGCLAQLTHAYRSIYGTNDAPAALLKASILNTATDLGNVGPDFKFGWGGINAWRALQLLEKNQWLESEADQNAVVTHTLDIPAGVKEAKIMIYWAEPPAAENNAKALINDLDLRVENASGLVSLPWKLNPTPNATILNTPAGKGRDSLNNMEQVLIVDPAAGTYTIHITGTAVPQGPQHYYIVWEFVKDEIKVTYPAGGEGFVPGEVERLHWDAVGNTGTFTLRYSTDGGNSFLPITTLGGDRRMYDWVVPNTVSGKVHFLVLRGAVRDTSDFPFSIVPVPQNLQVTRVCPDSLTISYTKVNDTLSYEGYLLGEKYMEIKGTSNSNAIVMPISSAGDEKWISVRSSHADGTAGRRAIAINWPGELLNCAQSHDLAVRQLLSPAGDAIVSCGVPQVDVSIRVNNEGLTASTGSTVHYQVDNNPPVSEPLPDIPAGGSVNFTFQTPLIINTNGNILFKVWVEYPSDVVLFNDTMAMNYPVVSGAESQFFVEDFESAPGLPLGWRIVNPDNSRTWQSTDQLNSPIVGPDDLIGRSLHMNFYDYGPNSTGQEDFLYMIPVDLTNLNEPMLTFAVAHCRYNNAFNDGLRVEVLQNCDLGATPTTIWEKFDPELSTTANQTGYFYPNSGAQWRTETVSLDSFAGQRIVVRFVSINGYSNSLYLDNIGVSQFIEPALPVAEFAAPDSVCRLDTVSFVAVASTPGSAYLWSFGSGALPSSATGLGPHNVSYATVGNKNVRLIVENQFGRDTLVQVVTVGQLATANFTFVQNGFSLTFTNTSTSADTYLWDFGDGNTSTEANPSYVYGLPGTYTVTLYATNDCRTHVKTATVGVSAVNDLSEQVAIVLSPNPTAGDFSVQMDSRISGSVQCVLFDATGKQVAQREALLKPGTTRVAFEQLNLPKGVYQLNIQAGGKQATLQVVVQ